MSKLAQQITLLVLLIAIIFTTEGNAQSGSWVWLHGSSNTNAAASYGIQGVYSTTNVPQSNYEGCFWNDMQGNFWIYGGQTGNSQGLADLWKYDLTINQWMWVKGPGGIINVMPVYGIQGIPSPLNTPGSRFWTAATWADKQNNLWLLGGYSAGDKNDLWKYNITTNEWTWMSGTTVANHTGNYGTKHVPNVGNILASRHEIASTFIDTSGNFWVFGGYRATYGNFNDLWKYYPLTNEWSWESGDSTTNAIANYGQQNVATATNNPGGRYIQTSWSDCYNNLYIFGGVIWKGAPEYLNDVWKYNIPTQMWTWVSGTSLANSSGSYISYCNSSNINFPSGRTEARTQAKDNCGNAFIYGGFKNINNNQVYGDLWSYNLFSNSWIWLSGSSLANSQGSYGTKGIIAPTNHPPARAAAYTFADSIGNVYLFGGFRSNNLYCQDIWKFIPDTNCIKSNCSACGIIPSATFISSDTLFCEKQAIDFYDLSQNNPTSWQWTFSGAVPSSSTLQNPTGIYYPSNGTYDVTLVACNALGCDTISFVSYINVFSIPTLQLPSDTLLCLGDSINLIPNTNASAYLWQNGSSNSTFMVNSQGTYIVTVTDSGCVNSDTCIVSYKPCSLPVINLASSDTLFCEKQAIDFYDLSQNNPTSWQWTFSGAVPSSSTLQNPTGIYYSSYGSFDVTLIACNAAGCDSLHFPNFITELAQPPAPVISMNYDTLFSSFAYGYQWFYNGNPIANATANYYIPLVNGNYYVVISDSVGCINSSNVITLTNVGIAQHEASTLHIIPNPTTDVVHIYLPQAREAVLSIVVTDIAGHALEVQSKRDVHGTIILSLQPYAQGTYMVTITTPHANYKGMVIKK